MVRESYEKTMTGLLVLPDSQNLLENQILQVFIHTKACKIIRKSWIWDSLTMPLYL